MEEILKFIASSGISGAILAYFLYRINPAVKGFEDKIIAALRSMENAIDTSSKADLLRMISSPHVADAIKDAASQLLPEIAAREKAREIEKPPTV